VNRVSDQSAAADRARWLAELSAALNEALDHLPGLMIAGPRAELIELHSRLEAARAEVASLRRCSARELSVEVGPEWTQMFGQSGSNYR